MNILSRVVATCMLLAFASVSQAVTVSINPANQIVQVGSTISLTLDISGLGNGIPPSLGAFDLNIAYDPTVLSFGSVSFGDSALGDQLDVLGLGSITSFDSSVNGTVNIFELSLDSPSDLDSLQAGSFTLATLTFSAASAGISLLDLSINALGDPLGNPLTATAISTQLTAVPIPSAFWLLGSGVLWFVGSVMRFRG